MTKNISNLLEELGFTRSLELPSYFIHTLFSVSVKESEFENLPNTEALFVIKQKLYNMRDIVMLQINIKLEKIEKLLKEKGE